MWLRFSYFMAATNCTHEVNLAEGSNPSALAKALFCRWFSTRNGVGVGRDRYTLPSIMERRTNASPYWSDARRPLLLNMISGAAYTS